MIGHDVRATNLNLAGLRTDPKFATQPASQNDSENHGQEHKRRDAN